MSRARQGLRNSCRSSWKPPVRNCCFLRTPQFQVSWKFNWCGVAMIWDEEKHTRSCYDMRWGKAHQELLWYETRTSTPGVAMIWDEDKHTRNCYDMRRGQAHQELLWYETRTSTPGVAMIWDEDKHTRSCYDMRWGQAHQTNRQIDRIDRKVASRNQLFSCATVSLPKHQRLCFKFNQISGALVPQSFNKHSLQSRIKDRIAQSV